MNVYQELGIFHCALTFFGTALLQIAGLQPLGCRHSHQGSSAVYWPLMRHLHRRRPGHRGSRPVRPGRPAQQAAAGAGEHLPARRPAVPGRCTRLAAVPGRRRTAAAASSGSTGSNRLKVAGAVVFGGVLGPVLLLLGLRTAQASSVSLLLNLELVATALLGVLLFKDHLTASGWLSRRRGARRGRAGLPAGGKRRADLGALGSPPPASAGGWTTTSPR